MKRQEVKNNVIGSKILKVEHLTREEIEYLGWYCDPLDTLVFTLDRGSEILVMQDPEGNGPGWVEVTEIDPVNGSQLTTDAREYKMLELSYAGKE
jgi:hypothetical protein